MCVEGQTSLVRPFRGDVDMLPKWPPIRGSLVESILGDDFVTQHISWWLCVVPARDPWDIPGHINMRQFNELIIGVGAYFQVG